jgi:hypothetical protein
MKLEIVLPEVDDDELSSALCRLTRLLGARYPDLQSHGLLGGEDGYGVNFENDVFLMKPYCWCERTGECPWCTGCGYYQETQQCATCREGAYPHSATCYQTELAAAMAEYDKRTGYKAIEDAFFGTSSDLTDMLMSDMEFSEVAPGVTVGMSSGRGESAVSKAWQKASGRRSKYRDGVYRRLARKHNVDPVYGAAVHCTCGATSAQLLACATKGCDYQLGTGIFARFAPWTSDHESGYYDPPNFWYKPTDFRVTWYKYIGRDQASRGSVESLDAMVEHCLLSAGCSVAH